MVFFVTLVLSFVSTIVLSGRERGHGWMSGGMRGREWSSVAIEGSIGDRRESSVVVLFSPLVLVSWV